MQFLKPRVYIFFCLLALVKNAGMCWGEYEGGKIDKKRMTARGKLNFV